MKIHFDTPELDAHLLRTISYAYYGGSDIGECLITAQRIKDGSIDSWFDAWYETADRLFQLAETSLAIGNLVHAKEAFLRSSNYFRTAFAFHKDPQERRLQQAYDRHEQSFARATQLFSNRVETVSFSYLNRYSIPGYLYFSPNAQEKAPVVIATGGYDQTHQEAYFFSAVAALRQGMHVLCYDGPGQGAMLFKERCSMTSSWEKVVSPIVDFLIQKKEIDEEKIFLSGTSWGGFLAAKAAAFEPRIAALIVNPGHFDALESIEAFIPNIRDLINRGEKTQIHQIFEHILGNKYLGRKFRDRLFTFGVSTLYELLQIWMNFHLRDVVAQIRCPTFVADAQNETLSTSQGKEFFNALNCPKEYVLFKNAEGAGEHCENGALSLFHQKMFNWLHHIFLKEPSLHSMLN